MPAAVAPEPTEPRGAHRVVAPVPVPGRPQLQPSWRSHRERARRWDPPEVPTVVVVPHPDDEVLLHGGLIRRQRTRGVPVTIVAVTEGEAAYPTVAPDELAARRRVEQHRALHLLGVDPSDVITLGLPDGAVAAHTARLALALDPIVADAGLVVAPWLGDHHIDHETCGRLALAAGRRHGVPVRHGLFWAWSRGAPDSPPFAEMVRLELTGYEREARARALDCHRSQVSDELAPALLNPVDLEPLTWDVEHYVVACER